EGSHAVVRSTTTETDVRVRRPGDVESVGIVEHSLVAVGRRVDHRHPVAFANVLTMQLGVLSRRAPKCHDWCRPADKLLDGDLDVAVEVLLQQRLLLRELL